MGPGTEKTNYLRFLLLACNVGVGLEMTKEAEREKGEGSGEEEVPSLVFPLEMEEALAQGPLLTADLIWMPLIP